MAGICLVVSGPKELHYASGGGLLTLPQKVLMEVPSGLGWPQDVAEIYCLLPEKLFKPSNGLIFFQGLGIVLYCSC